MIESPFAIDMVDRFPTREIVGQESPLNTAFHHIKDRIDDLAAIRRRSSGLAWFRNHRLQDIPLSVSQARFVKSDFHRFNGAALLMVNASVEP